MKLTMDHLRFWRDRQPQPSWATDIKRTQRPPTIHNLINSQTDFRVESEPHNTIQILKSVRTRDGDIVTALVQMAARPNCVNGAKRSAWCKRWWRRLKREVEGQE